MRTEQEVQDHLQHAQQEVEDMEEAVADSDSTEERAFFKQNLSSAKARRHMLQWMLGSQEQDKAEEANRKARFTTEEDFDRAAFLAPRPNQTEGARQVRS